MPDDPFQIPRPWALERGKAGAAVMKIGVITDNYPRFRGDFSGRFVESLSEALVTFGHKVTVLAPWDPAYARLSSDDGVELEFYRYAPLARWHRLGYAPEHGVRSTPAWHELSAGPAALSRGPRAVWQWADRERPRLARTLVAPNGYLAVHAARHSGYLRRVYPRL